jgi:hypothetical protein
LAAARRALNASHLPWGLVVSENTSFIYYLVYGPRVYWKAEQIWVTSKRCWVSAVQKQPGSLFSE